VSKFYVPPLASVSSMPSLEEIALASIWPMGFHIFSPTSRSKSESSNTSELARKIPKGMILGPDLPYPTGIIALDDDEESCGK
jgi:hypothetical protein